MRIHATPEARSMILDEGGLLFVWTEMTGRIGRVLRTSTKPPKDALDWIRYETKGVLVFLPPWMKRRPNALDIEVNGWWRRKVHVYWNGSAIIV